jgi:hypothetical protein
VARASEVELLAKSTGLTLKTIHQVPWFLEGADKKIVLIAAEPPASVELPTDQNASRVVVTSFETETDEEPDVKVR